MIETTGVDQLGALPERPWHAVWPPPVPRSLDYPLVPAWWLLERNLERHAHRVAVRCLDHTTGEERAAITYRELAMRARAVAAGLRQLGVAKGDRVALYLPNCVELVASYYGVWESGAIGVPVNTMSTASELAHQIADAQASVLITTAALSATAAPVAAAQGAHLIVVGARARPDGAVTFEELLAASPQAPEPLDPREDLALLLYTGGTTGVPKGAMLTHFNLVANALQFATWYDMREEEETCIATLPMFHSGGLAGALNVPLAAGATLLLFERFNPLTVVQAIERYRATRFFGVPTMYIAVLNNPACRGYDLSSLRACRTNGAALPPSVKAAFDEFVGHEVLVEGYGLSETSPLTHANPPHAPRPGSIGIPLTDTDARIIDPVTGTDVPHGGEGELVLRGPQVMKGYWGRPDATANAFTNGWFHTGDIAIMDPDGYFRIVDRIKDCIVVAGYKVWPREVEDALYAHPSVRQVAVVGTPDAYRGESVCAYVVLREDADKVSGDALRTHCRARLAAYKVPRVIELRTELPMSGPGKVLRRVLRDEARSAAEQRAAALDAATNGPTGTRGRET
jgi:long-chain acyl-CoA synthetase